MAMPSGRRTLSGHSDSLPAFLELAGEVIMGREPEGSVASRESHEDIDGRDDTGRCGCGGDARVLSQRG